MQGGFRPGLEPVDDSGVDGGQEALTAHAEVGSYRTGCEHHVQVVAHLHDTHSSMMHGLMLSMHCLLVFITHVTIITTPTVHTNLTVSSSDSAHVC